MPTFVIHAQKSPEALARIVLLFHRLAIEIDALAMRPVPDSSSVEVEIDTRLPEDQIVRVEACLLRLIDVTSVEINP